MFLSWAISRASHSRSSVHIFSGSRLNLQQVNIINTKKAYFYLSWTDHRFNTPPAEADKDSDGPKTNKGITNHECELFQQLLLSFSSWAARKESESFKWIKMPKTHRMTDQHNTCTLCTFAAISIESLMSWKEENEEETFGSMNGLLAGLSFA